MNNFNDMKKSMIKYKKILILSVIILIPIFYLASKVNLGNPNDIIILMVQIDAAIIVIILSLSLVAVQIAAQSYSTRVISAFKDNIVFKTMLVLYISSIVYGLIFLILNNAGIINNTLIIYPQLVLSTYIISIVAILALVPYIQSAFDLMEPTKIIENLSKKISKKSFKKYIEDVNEGINSEIPIQPIMDIVNFSLAKNDSYTAIHGLQTIKEHVSPIINNKNNEIQNRKKILSYILIELREFGLIAANRKDEKLSKESIKTINSIITTLIDEELNQLLDKLNSYPKGEERDKEEIKKKVYIETMTMDSIDCIEKIGEVAIEHGLRDAVTSAISSISHIGIKMVSNHLNRPTNISTNSLGRLGVLLTKNKFDFEVFTLLEALMKIVTEANNSRHAIAFIGKIGIGAIINNLDIDIILESIKCLSDIAKDEFKAIEKDKGSLEYNEKNLFTILNYLEKIGMKTINQEMSLINYKQIMNDTLKTMEEIVEISGHNNNDLKEVAQKGENLIRNLEKRKEPREREYEKYILEFNYKLSNRNKIDY